MYMKNIYFIFFLLFIYQNSLALSDINETTSRYIRTKIMCDIATMPGYKPRFTGRDNIIVSDTNYVYADLNGDGFPELITGAWDEPLGNYKLRHYPDHKSRNRSAFQYHFYSNDPDFIVPKGTHFLMARTILNNDFNNDGKSDLVFIQHGPDFAPYVPRNNQILISQADGSYKVSYLPGPKSLFHGGASGDVDGDGDIDIVVTPGPKNEVLIYLNNGDGTFKFKTLLKNVGRNYNLSLWDVDGDQNLDLLIDGNEEPLTIFWGEGTGKFLIKQIISGFDNQVMQDIEFADLNNDGQLELIVLSSLKGMKKRKGWYVGFKVQSITAIGREFKYKNLIHHSPIFWLPWISGCDLKNDGDIDLVYEQHGERWHGELMVYTKVLDFTKLDKLIWENQGNGDFHFYVLEDPQYFDYEKNSNIHQKYITKLVDKAENLGVTLVTYLTNQVYYPFENGKTYYGYKFFHPNNQRNTPLYLNGPTPNDYSGIENEYTNKIVKNPFQKITKKPNQFENIKTVCMKAITDEGKWNDLASIWVNSAIERGFTLKMCIDLLK